MSDSGVPRGSVWEHTVSGRKFVVVEPNVSALPDSHPHRLEDMSEEFVYCAVDEYEEYSYVWLAKRLFESQLELLSEGVDVEDFYSDYM